MKPLDQLTQAVRDLNAMLSDQHPGLFTWQAALRDRAEALAALINEIYS